MYPIYSGVKIIQQTTKQNKIYNQTHLTTPQMESNQNYYLKNAQRVDNIRMSPTMEQYGNDNRIITMRPLGVCFQNNDNAV